MKGPKQLTIRTPSPGLARRLREVLAIVLLFAAGCGMGCPNVQLEVRPFTGDAITANQVDCTGDLVYRLCDGPPEAVHDVEGGCGASKVRIGPGRQGGDFLLLYLDGESDASLRVRARLESLCDDDSCDPSATDPRGGAVSLEEVDLSRHGRIAGRYQVEFDDGTVSGAFDTSIPF